MRYRSLGNSGLIVSVTGLGCNNFGRRLDLDATREVVDAALEAGATLLDTADMYGGGEARRNCLERYWPGGATRFSRSQSGCWPPSPAAPR